MTLRFPDTGHFTGLNAPVRMEYDIRELAVEGEIPADISGAFFRAVPDPAYPPLHDNDVVLSGDGMISRFLFENGHVDCAIRYVHTKRFLAERAARRALFGRYRNLYTDDPSVANIDRTVANTTPVWHAGRLLMTKEDGRPYEINPHTLDTVGPFDFDGQLKSETFTAHVRVDPDTQEMFCFGYQAGGLCSLDIAYLVADRNGLLTKEQWFKAPYCAMIHDFAITEHYAIFPIFPTVADMEVLKAGGPHWKHRQELESWVGILPRDGDVKDVRWFRGPAGVSAYHVMNSFDEDGKVHLDLCLSETNAFPFIRDDSEIKREQWEIGGGFIRWTFDMNSPEDTMQTRVLGPPGDLPRIRDQDQGRPYEASWYLSMDPNAKGPPLSGGPVLSAFNCLLRIEPGTGRIDSFSMPPGWAINEPVHVPPANGGAGGGWLVTVVDEQRGDDFLSEIWIFDAVQVAAGPVAKVKIPIRQRPQVHGWWVPMADLANSKVGAAAKP
jgi:carotenoid cleavage dioxygenase-like enzyme